MGIAKMNSNQCGYVYLTNTVSKVILCDELKHKKSWFWVPKNGKKRTVFIDFHWDIFQKFSSPTWSSSRTLPSLTITGM